jgi:HlyD family secretion protein
MADTLSSDLASLKIDRDSKPKRGGGGGRVLRTLVILALLGGLGLVGYTQGSAYLEAKFFKTAIEVTEVALVSPAQASIELTSTGYVVPQLRTEVGAKVAGRVAKVLVREGQQVKAGDVLIELERADQVAAMQAAKMRVAASRARVLTVRASQNEIKRQAERQKVLAERGAAPAAGVEDLALREASLAEQVKASEAEVAAAEAEVEALRVNLGNMTVTAPISGTVLGKPPEVGELVGMDMGGGLGRTIELADFSSIVVETDVPEARLHLVKVGSPCEIVLDAYPTKRFRGEALEIMPRVNRAKATVGVKVKFTDDATGVLPDMSARVSFLAKALDAAQLQEKPKTIVPASALAERGGSKVVFVVDSGIVRMRPVQLGPVFGDGFELISGPDPGTKLVKSPAATLADGQPVKERDAS